jgi:putative membrane protein
MDNLLVVCVDRDNDLGKKTGIKGPVVGREKNLEAASKLALADPGEADANTIFAAVKKFDELKESIKTVEVVTLTGHGKSGFQSDKVLNQQLDTVLKKFKPEGFVLVTDGSEDDQIIPVLQSHAKIVSKETLVIKQAQQIESAFFTLKEVIKDPYVARIVFGIPAILLLLFVAVGTMSFQIIAFVLGVYLLLKGFGLEEPILDRFRSLGNISVQRMSFPFYIGSIFIGAFGVITAYNKFLTMQISEPFLDAVAIVQSTYLFIVLAGISVVIGKSIDAVQLKKAFLLRKYMLTGISILLFWWILDTATLVLLREVDLNLFLTTILGSFLVLLIAFRLSEVLDVREKVTKLLVGLPIYTIEGTWLGRVEAIDKRKKSITYLNRKNNKPVEVGKKRFALRKGKIVLSA